MKFEVDSVFTLKDRNLVFVGALRLEHGDFRVTTQSTLGGVPLQEFLETPRKTMEDGIQDMDTFVFCLKNASDKDHFVPGQVVEFVG